MVGLRFNFPFLPYLKLFSEKALLRLNRSSGWPFKHGPFLPYQKQEHIFFFSLPRVLCVCWDFSQHWTPSKRHHFAICTSTQRSLVLSTPFGGHILFVDWHFLKLLLDWSVFRPKCLSFEKRRAWHSACANLSIQYLEFNKTQKCQKPSPKGWSLSLSKETWSGQGQVD